MIERRGFFGRLAALAGVFSLPAQVSMASESPGRKGSEPRHRKLLVIDLDADRKHFEQYEVFDADTREPIYFPVFYADEGEGIIRFWAPFPDKLETRFQLDRDKGIKFEITDQGTGIFESWAGKPSLLPWMEMRRRIVILKRLTPEQHFKAQAAIT